MSHYSRFFPSDLQAAAEAAGKDFCPEDKTELEIQLLWELWLEWDGDDLVEFVQRFL